MTLHLGLMGGMFDPVHRGHLQLAMTATRLLQLDAVRLIPCQTPNHRELPICSAEQRLAMLYLAVADCPGLEVDEQEIRRAGVSYSVDTLRSVAAEMPGASLVYILGMDAFASLPGWHRWEELFSYCHFLVFSRPGYALQPDNALNHLLPDRQVTTPEELFEAKAGRVLLHSSLSLAVSSSLVRQRIVDGESISNLVPGVVERYLVEHRLYHKRH